MAPPALPELRIPTDLKYGFDEPTIGPFNVDGDAKLFHEAMAGAGTSDELLITLMTARTTPQLKQIAAAYEKNYGKPLEQVIKGDTSGKYEDALVALLKDSLELDVWQLHKAIDGLGTTESVLSEVLTSRPNAHLKAVKELYAKKYGEELVSAIKGDTSGDFERVLVSLLACDRSESTTVDPKKAAQDAAHLYRAGEGRLGTNEDTFISILTKNSPAQLAEIGRQYRQLGNHSLVQAIEKETSGDFKNTLIALVDPPYYFAMLIHKAVAGFGTDDQALIRLLAGVDKPRLYLAKHAYRRKYGKCLAHAVESDTSGDYRKVLLRLCCATQSDYEALKIREAFRGLGTNTTAVMNVLCKNRKRTNEHVAHSFELDYDDSLAKAIKSETHGPLEAFLVALATPRSVFDAKELYEAMKGIGTTESVLIEILTTRTNAQINAIREVYRKNYGKELIDDIKADTTGNFEKVLVNLALGKRSEATSITNDEATKVAAALYKGGEGKFGTDDSLFVSTFTSRNPIELAAIDTAYEKAHGHSLAVAIKKECSGDYADALFACCYPDQYAARCLVKAMKGLGTSEKKLIRVLAARDRDDMSYVTAAFEQEAGGSLRSWIEGDTSGAFRKALLQWADL